MYFFELIQWFSLALCYCHYTQCHTKYGKSFLAVMLQSSLQYSWVSSKSAIWSHFETLHSFWNLTAFWKALIFEYNVLSYKIFFLILLSDRRVILCYCEAHIHHRLQCFSSGAGCCCVDPLALQVGTDYVKISKCCLEKRQTDRIWSHFSSVTRASLPKGKLKVCSFTRKSKAKAWTAILLYCKQKRWYLGITINL